MSTMPSGSTRLTVTFLYSFPSVVLKSSANAIDAKQTIKIAKVGALIFSAIRFLRRRRWRGSVFFVKIKKRTRRRGVRGRRRIWFTFFGRGRIDLSRQIPGNGLQPFDSLLSLWRPNIRFYFRGYLPELFSSFNLLLLAR